MHHSVSFSYLVEHRGIRILAFGKSAVLRAARPCSDRDSPPGCHALSGSIPLWVFHKNTKDTRFCLFGTEFLANESDFESFVLGFLAERSLQTVFFACTVEF